MTERPPADNMTSVRLTHIGGPTVLLEIGGWRILTDPTFDDPGRTYHFGLGTSSRKVVGPALGLDQIGPVDCVLLSHDHHADNLDDAGRVLLGTTPTVLTTVAGAKRLGGTTRGLSAWDTSSLDEPGRPTIEVTATPCRHGPPLSRPLVGDVIGFALRWEGQARGVLWMSGDTVLYPGVRSVADRLDVGVVLLHLGEVRFPITGPLRYTMGIEDGIELCRALDAHTVIPVHYEGWSHFSEGRTAIERAVAEAPEDVRARFRLLPIGSPEEIAV
jgi:L-ascorbate metabolism protein UlaG (beta-lactamase superfamily)